MVHHDLSSSPVLANLQPDHKPVHHVMPRWRRDRFFPSIEARDIAACHICQRHFRMRISCIAMLQCNGTNIFHLQIPAVQLFHFFHCVNGRFALPVKAGIHQKELPDRRSPLGYDSVLAAENMDVESLVPDILHCRAGGSDVEIHMLQRTVLGDMKAYGDGRRISLLELKIDVAHPAVKRELRAIAERSALLRTIVRKMDHVFAAFLKPRRILSQHKNRPFLAIPDQPDPLPYEDCFFQAIAPFGNEDHTAARRFLHAIDSQLQRTCVVAGSVGVHAKLILCQIDGPRVFRSNRIIRIGMKRNGRNHGQE